MKHEFEEAKNIIKEGGWVKFNDEGNRLYRSNGELAQWIDDSTLIALISLKVIG